MTLINLWKEFLDSVDTPGGHILVLLILLGLGLWLGSMELQVASMGALFAMLRTTQSNHDRQQNGKGPSA